MYMVTQNFTAVVHRQEQEYFENFHYGSLFTIFQDVQEIEQNNYTYNLKKTVSHRYTPLTLNI